MSRPGSRNSDSELRAEVDTPSSSSAAIAGLEESNPWDDRPAGLVRNLHLYAAMLAIAAIIILVSMQIVFRYVFYLPLSWPPELAIYLHIWLVFLGITVALRSDSHVRVDYFPSKLPPRLRWLIELLGDLCSILLAIVVMISSFYVIGDVAGQATPALRMPMPLFFAATLTGFTLFTLALLVRSVNRIRSVPQSQSPSSTSAASSNLPEANSEPKGKE